MRNIFVEAELQALGIDQHHLHFFRARLIQDGHHQRVDEHALAGAGRSGDQQVRHGRQVGHANAPVQVAAHRQREFARRIGEFWRFNNLAQRNRLPIYVRHFDADRGFAGNALDQDRFRLQRQAQVFRQADDAAVFDARFGLEFEGGDHRAGIDLRHAPLHVELQALLLDRAGSRLQLVFIQFLAALSLAQ